MKIGFRDCTKADLAVVQRLVEELYASDPNTLDVKPNVSLTYKALSEKPDKGRLIVFDVDGVIVGYAIMIFFWSNEYGGNIIDIDECYIAAEYRNAGIGTKFFAWLEETFPDQVGLGLQTSYENEGALRMCKRLGFAVSRNQHWIRIKE